MKQQISAVNIEVLLFVSFTLRMTNKTALLQLNVKIHMPKLNKLHHRAIAGFGNINMKNAFRFLVFSL